MADSKSHPPKASPHPSLPAFESQPLEDTEIQRPAIEQLATLRVHILGLGSIGTLVAHSLRGLPNPPPIALMMHRQQQCETFKRKGCVINLIDKTDNTENEQKGYDIDLFEDAYDGGNGRWRFVPDSGPAQQSPSNVVGQEETTSSEELYIYSLIVTVKGPATVSALRSVKHRVNAESTICFMQNGLGQIDELNREVFSDPTTRPTYIQGIVSHGAYMSEAYTVVHAGHGTIALGICRDYDRYPLLPAGPVSGLSEDERRKFQPTDRELFSNPSSQYLLRTLTESPVLACTAFSYLDLLQLQLSKLASNCVLNPLTALLDVPNGALLNNDQLLPIQRSLLTEISLVIQGLRELDGLPHVQHLFSAERLEQAFVGLAKGTAQNSSSMREDIRNAKQPEIDYINGYIVKKGEEQGIKCQANLMIMQLIKSKHSLRSL